MADDDWNRPVTETRPHHGEHRWERDTLREIALEGIREKRRARRWGIFFKLLLAVYLAAILMMSMQIGPFLHETGVGGPHTAVVDVIGPIADDTAASAERVIEGLRAAFDAGGVKGIILNINSPGGSPVQAGRVNDALGRLRKEHPDTPVYAVAGDVCASGAYYIAVGADRIYADKASIVGSIGVLMGSFGFTGAMDKLGVERRLYSSGRNKTMLDPFSPTKERHIEHVQEMLDRIHRQFIQTVKDGRGDRLKGDPDKLFSGLFWTGAESAQLGLIDGLGGPGYVAREIIGAENIVNYTPSENVLERLAERVGAGAATTLASTLGWSAWNLR